MDALVTVSVYSTLGEEVASLVDGVHAAGSYEVEWKGTRKDGIPLSTGVYFVKMSAKPVTNSQLAGPGGYSAVRKVLLMK